MGYNGSGRVDGAARSTLSQRRKILVTTTRKVWETLKSSTCSTVATVFKKLTSQSLADRVRVKRKYTTNPSGSVNRWWYVIRGEELDIAELEKAQEAIATQTGWKLEPVFRYDNHDKTTSPTSELELQGTQFNVIHVIVPTVAPNNNECDDCGSEDKVTVTI